MPKPFGGTGGGGPLLLGGRPPPCGGGGGGGGGPGGSFPWGGSLGPFPSGGPLGPGLLGGWRWDCFRCHLHEHLAGLDVEEHSSHDPLHYHYKQGGEGELYFLR